MNHWSKRSMHRIEQWLTNEIIEDGRPWQGEVRAIISSISTDEIRLLIKLMVTKCSISQQCFMLVGCLVWVFIVYWLCYIDRYTNLFKLCLKSMSNMRDFEFQFSGTPLLCFNCNFVALSLFWLKFLVLVLSLGTFSPQTLGENEIPKVFWWASPNQSHERTKSVW